MIPVIDASATNAMLRAAEEVGWSRSIGKALDILTAASRTATPAEMTIIHALALRFAQCSAEQIESLHALRVEVEAPAGKGAA